MRSPTSDRSHTRTIATRMFHATLTIKDARQPRRFDRLNSGGSIHNNPSSSKINNPQSPNISNAGDTPSILTRSIRAPQSGYDRRQVSGTNWHEKATAKNKQKFYIQPHSIIKLVNKKNRLCPLPHSILFWMSFQLQNHLSSLTRSITIFVN